MSNFSEHARCKLELSNLRNVRSHNHRQLARFSNDCGQCGWRAASGELGWYGYARGAMCKPQSDDLGILESADLGTQCGTRCNVEEHRSGHSHHRQHCR
jgi:hypothetical protein